MKMSNYPIVIIVLVALLIIGVAVLLVANQPTRDVVDYDIYLDAQYCWLFTIEETQPTVHSQLYDQTLIPGRYVRVYRQTFTHLNQATQAAVLHYIDARHQRAVYQNVEGLIDAMPLIYQNDMQGANPWLISVGQMDDDAGIEIFVGAYKATRYYPAETRPYFLEFRSGHIIRQWTGTYLNSQGFIDAVMYDTNGNGYAEVRLTERKLMGAQIIDCTSDYILQGFMPLSIKSQIIE